MFVHHAYPYSLNQEAHSGKKWVAKERPGFKQNTILHEHDDMPANG